MVIKIDPKVLLEGGAHFGHQTKRWNPKMGPFIYGSEDGVHIIDLIKTKQELEKALDVIKDASSEGKSILFLGTKKQVKNTIKDVATDAGCLYVNERWLGGTLTNFDQIKKSVKLLAEMKEKRDKGDYNIYTKKERVLIDREINRLERFFGGLSGIEQEPGLIVIIDVKKEKPAAMEAKKMGVPTIGIVDTNSDPEMVDYPIPMNDDATNALIYILNLMKEAVLAGKSKKAVRKVNSKNE